MVKDANEDSVDTEEEAEEAQEEAGHDPLGSEGTGTSDRLLRTGFLVLRRRPPSTVNPKSSGGWASHT